jgi:hypothetical protein
MTITSEIPFQQVLDALLDTETPFTPRFLYRLSDLEAGELNRLEQIWESIPPWRRKALMEDVEKLSEENTLLSFEALAYFALKDGDAEVRLPAVRALGEYEEPYLASSFLRLVKGDPDTAVRAAAAFALGKFVYLGELEEISEEIKQTIEDVLLDIYNHDTADLVRRNALEALGYSSRDEVTSLIDLAYRSTDREWKASALFAMGRSANPIWKPQVLEMLDSPHPILRAEAARAAGELELTPAVVRLLELIDDPDDETRLASIWSLSQLGGPGVQEAMQRAYDETEVEKERNFIESAIDNLIFNQDMQLLPMFDLPDLETASPYDDDDEDFEDDLLDELDFEDDFDDDDYAAEDEILFFDDDEDIDEDLNA